jgi:uncharacterized protein (DUF2461 family)
MSNLDQTEYNKWVSAEYPYDRAECNNCATEHMNTKFPSCSFPAHAEMRREASNLKLRKLRDKEPAKFRKVVLAFREKYARFYDTRPLRRPSFGP